MAMTRPRSGPDRLHVLGNKRRDYTDRGGKVKRPYGLLEARAIT